MNKKNFLFLILGVIFIAALIAAMSLLVRKYERDSISAGQLVPRQASETQAVPRGKNLENTAPFEGVDNQPSTEKGKFLQ